MPLGHALRDPRRGRYVTLQFEFAEAGELREPGLVSIPSPLVTDAAEQLGRRCDRQPSPASSARRPADHSSPVVAGPDPAARRLAPADADACTRRRPGTAQPGAHVLVEEVPALAADPPALATAPSIPSSPNSPMPVSRCRSCRRCSARRPWRHAGQCAAAQALALRGSRRPQQLSTAEPLAMHGASEPRRARGRAAPDQHGRVRDLRALHGAARGRLRHARRAARQLRSGDASSSRPRRRPSSSSKRSPPTRATTTPRRRWPTLRAEITQLILSAPSTSRRWSAIGGQARPQPTRSPSPGGMYQDSGRDLEVVERTRARTPAYPAVHRQSAGRNDHRPRRPVRRRHRVFGVEDRARHPRADPRHQRLRSHRVGALGPWRNRRGRYSPVQPAKSATARPLLTGWVDSYKPSYDATSHNI